MAKFNIELPTELVNEITRLADKSDKVFGEMVKAGAEVVKNNIYNNVPQGIRTSPMMKNLKITKVYKTPSDDGINCTVGFYGYFRNEDNRLTPAPLVANVFEYGRSNSAFPKKPFMRRSFKKAEIEAAMRKAQEKASGGLLK